MALTPGRVVALALVAMALAVTFLLPPPPRRGWRAEPYVQVAARQAENAVLEARRSIAVRLLRDSARVAAGATSDPGVQSRFIGPWRDAERAWLLARVRDIRGSGPAVGAAAIVFARDSALASYPLLFYALPDAPEAACVAIYAEHPRWAGARRGMYRRAGPGLLGACAYYGRFGVPGAAVYQWLRRGGAALAMTSPTYPPPVNRPPAGRGGGVLATFRGDTWWWSADPRLAAPLAPDACLAGHEPSCRALVTDRRPRVGTRELSALGVHVETAWTTDDWTATFLADLLNDVGAERFAALWRSAGTFEDAFAAAVGIDLGSWTREWARARLGSRTRRPSVTGAAIGTSIGAVLGFLLLAVVVAVRRRSRFAAT